jgi:glycosyltransferase involved in cell wall biosynthesis
VNDAGGNEPRSIALAITELETGGAERALTQLAIGLQRRGWRVRVDVIAPRPEPPRDSLVTELEEAGISVHFLGHRSGLFMPFAVPLVVSRWARLWHGWKPDVVQSFLFHANVTAACAARRAKVPRVCTGIRVADPRRWRHAVERWSLRWADKAICVSESVANFCRTTVRFPPAKVTTVPNGVDVERFQSAVAKDLTSLGIPAGHHVLTCVGRLDAQKGLDWLLHLMPELFAREENVDLLLVGQGPQEWHLRQIASSLGINQRVHVAGWQPDIPAILKASTVLLLPSRWEGMPNVLLEAMASGLPVVATRVEGVDEVLGEFAAEQSVAVEDREGFIGHILSILSSNQKQKELGRGNLKRVQKHFSIERMIDGYLESYGRIHCT